jgi:sulfur-oxidizing protein SoxX
VGFGLAAGLAAPLFAASTAAAQNVDHQAVGDGIPKPLTGKPGDAARGRALLVKRDAANCLNCHSIKGLPDGGTRGPSPDGVCSVLTPLQLRLSVVDYSKISREASMPNFHMSGTGQGATPKLSAAEVEDVFADLATLKK